MLPPVLASPHVNSEYSASNLSLKIRCETSHLRRCSGFLKAVRSFDSYVPSYFAESRGGPYGSVGKSIPVPFYP